MSSLELLYVSRANSEVHTVLAQLRSLNAHVSLLSRIGTGSSIDAGVLLKCATESKRTAIQLHHQLEALAEMAQSVTRRTVGSTYGAFRSNFDGARRRVAIEFDSLGSSMQKLDRIVTDRINEPGRWGDAAADTAVNEAIRFIGQLLDLWRLRVRKKIES